MKFGQAKHWTNETVLFRTGQATASFFILDICFPPATPFSSSTYCFAVGGGFSGEKISTTNFAGGGSSVIDSQDLFVPPLNYPFETESSHTKQPGFYPLNCCPSTSPGFVVKQQ